MKPKFLLFIAALLVWAAGARAGDFIEIKGSDDLSHIRIPLKAGKAYHSELQALPTAKTATTGTASEKDETGLYIGYSLQALTVKKSVEGTFTGNLLQGFIDFGSGEEKKLSPVLHNFEKKFVIQSPGKQWTKVTISKDTRYEVRWITE